jgi:hypothetical protein
VGVTAEESTTRGLVEAVEDHWPKKRSRWVKTGAAVNATLTCLGPACSLRSRVGGAYMGVTLSQTARKIAADL